MYKLISALTLRGASKKNLLTDEREIAKLYKDALEKFRNSEKNLAKFKFTKILQHLESNKDSLTEAQKKFLLDIYLHLAFVNSDKINFTLYAQLKRPEITPETLRTFYTTAEEGFITKFDDYAKFAFLFIFNYLERKESPLSDTEKNMFIHSSLCLHYLYSIRKNPENAAQIHRQLCTATKNTPMNAKNITFLYTNAENAFLKRSYGFAEYELRFIIQYFDYKSKDLQPLTKNQKTILLNSHLYLSAIYYDIRKAQQKAVQFLFDAAKKFPCIETALTAEYANLFHRKTDDRRLAISSIDSTLAITPPDTEETYGFFVNVRADNCTRTPSPPRNPTAPNALGIYITVPDIPEPEEQHYESTAEVSRSFRKARGNGI